MNIDPNLAHTVLADVVGQFVSMPVDFSDFPLLPKTLDNESLSLIRESARLAAQGDIDGAFALANNSPSEYFEFDYLKGKIMFARKDFGEATYWFNRAVIKFPEYGELWFLYGIANYQSGFLSEAFHDWAVAKSVNEDHQDAKLLLELATLMTKTTHPHLDPLNETGAVTNIGKGSEKSGYHDDSTILSFLGGKAQYERWITSAQSFVTKINSIPLTPDGKVDRQVESMIRRSHTSLLVTSGFSGKVAKTSAGMNIPYVALVTADSLVDRIDHNHFDLSTTFLFTDSEVSVKRYSDAGMKSACYLPPGVDESVIGNVVGSSQPDASLCVVKYNAGARYSEIIDRLKSLLMNKDKSVDEKNEALRFMRFIGNALTAAPEGGGGINDHLSGDNALLARLQFDEKELYKALDDEACHRSVSTLVKNLGGVVLSSPSDLAVSDNKAPPVTIIKIRASNDGALPQELFDSLAMGRFVLVNKTDSVMGLFTPDEDLVIYEDLSQINELAEFYQARPDLRARVTQSAMRKIMDKHTLRHRWKTILDTVGAS